MESQNGHITGCHRDDRAVSHFRWDNETDDGFIKIPVTSPVNCAVAEKGRLPRIGDNRAEIS